MKITGEVVKKIASLSKIRLSEGQTEEFAGQLAKIVDYADMLEEVDTSEAAPSSHVGEANNVLRGDKPEKFPSPEKIFRNAPDKHENYFKVPGIINRES